MLGGGGAWYNDIINRQNRWNKICLVLFLTNPFPFKKLIAGMQESEMLCWIKGLHCNLLICGTEQGFICLKIYAFHMNNMSCITICIETQSRSICNVEDDGKFLMRDTGR